LWWLVVVWVGCCWVFGWCCGWGWGVWGCVWWGCCWRWGWCCGCCGGFCAGSFVSVCVWGWCGWFCFGCGVFFGLGWFLLGGCFFGCLGAGGSFLGWVGVVLFCGVFGFWLFGWWWLLWGWG
ncbi:hypothetical protein, partial [Pseudomonas syringae group genomosp. 7]|uniref:hypothetical protein n=1 Tax=Pseudomonas syringae group genomosp. 7 TaxID=251699 RepID=UPI0037700980